MLEKLWFGSSCWTALAKLLLLPLTGIYVLLSTLRYQAYRLGILRCWQAPLPVVIVGNLTVGGNGKTPLIIWLVQQLQQSGLRVGVVSRGYGGQPCAAARVVTAESSAQAVGDEPVLIYQRTGAPVAVAARRASAVALLCQRYVLDVILADDGLQHYGLARDFELVVVDGIRRFGNGHRLPAGPLRENLNRLRTVDAVIVNGGTPQPGELPMQLRLTVAINLLSGEQQPISAFQGAVAMAGIGNPVRFFTLLAQQGLVLQRTICFRDHQPYRPERLQRLTVDQQPLLMTEKDAVKCRSFAQANWWFLPVEVELPSTAGEALLNRIIAEVKHGSAAIRKPGLPSVSRSISDGSTDGG